MTVDRCKACKAAATRWAHDEAMTDTTFTAVPNAVDRFLDAVGQGTVASASDIYAADVVLDATVPGWRLSAHGDDAVRAEYARWFADEATLEELDRHPTPGGEVVEYTLSWVEDGVPHAARHVHVLTIDRRADRIASDHVWCGGRWPASLLAEMGAVLGAEAVAGVTSEVDANVMAAEVAS